MVVRPAHAAPVRARYPGFPGDQAGLSRARPGAGFWREAYRRRTVANDQAPARTSIRIRRAGISGPLDGPGLVPRQPNPPPGRSPRLPGGVGRLLVGDARRARPCVSCARHAGSFDAARRRQQGHLGAFERTGGRIHAATSPRPAGGPESRREHLARVFRCILIGLTGEFGASGTSELDSLMKLYDCLASPPSRLSAEDPQGHLDQWRDLEQEILSLIFEEQRSDSLSAVLSRAARAAAQVRTSLSSDTLRVVSQFGAAHSSAWGYATTGEALAVLNRCIGTLAALRGIE